MHCCVPRLRGEVDSALDFSPGCLKFDSMEKQTFTSWFIGFSKKKPPEEIMVIVEYEHWQNDTAQNAYRYYSPTLWRLHTGMSVWHVRTRDKTFTYLHCTKIRTRLPHITCNRPISTFSWYRQMKSVSFQSVYNRIWKYFLKVIVFEFNIVLRMIPCLLFTLSMIFRAHFEILQQFISSKLFIYSHFI